MNRTIVVGDLHGNLELYKKIREKFSKDRIILMGDLLDSFIFPIEDQFELISTVLKDMNSPDIQVDCLFGNHELSYLMPKMRCSGFNPDLDAMLKPLKNQIRNSFRPYLTINSILITHAGVSKKFIDSYLDMTKSSHEPLFQITNFLDASWKNEGAVLNIGYSRGGRSAYPGIFWSDWNEDFKPIEGIRQICGHTPAKEIRHIGDNWCIDCSPSTSHSRTRTPMGVSIENGQVKQIELI